MEHEAEQDPSVLMRVAVRQVDKLTKAVNRYRILVIILGTVCAALIAGGVVLGITYSNVQAVVSAQGQQSYKGCLNGNDYRSGNQQIWVFLFDLITQNGPATARQVNAFLTLADKDDPGNSAIWAALATQLKGNPNSPAVVHRFLNYVAKVDAPRNCAPLKP